jgi:hypothetical protein
MIHSSCFGVFFITGFNDAIFFGKNLKLKKEINFESYIFYWDSNPPFLEESLVFRGIHSFGFLLEMF